VTSTAIPSEIAVRTKLANHSRGAGIAFILEPRIRYVGQPGEQATMFVLDPSGNVLEFFSPDTCRGAGGYYRSLAIRFLGKCRLRQSGQMP
jgi:hypothetical protein